jgi:hypothetical protein
MKGQARVAKPRSPRQLESFNSYDSLHVLRRRMNY